MFDGSNGESLSGLGLEDSTKWLSVVNARIQISRLGGESGVGEKRGDEYYASLPEWYYGYENEQRHEARRNQVWEIIEEYIKEQDVSKMVSILELAAGSGEFAKLAREKIGELEIEGKQKINYLAGEINEKALESLKKNGVECMALSVTDMSEIKNGEKDVVYAGELIEHLEVKDLDRFFFEVRRILKPGGLLVLTTPNYQSMIALQDYLFNKLPPLTFDPKRDPWASEHVTPFTLISLRDKLYQKGFKVERESTNQISTFLFSGENGEVERVIYPTLQSVDREMIEFGDSLIVAAVKR